METVEAHVGKIEAELGRWGAKIDDLFAKADSAGTGAKVDYRSRLDDLRAKYEAAQANFGRLKTAGNDKWQSFEVAIETAWSELEDAFKKLTAKKA
jgi:hypothetical protein